MADYESSLNQSIGYHYTYNFSDISKSYDGYSTFHIIPDIEEEPGKDITKSLDFDIDASYFGVIVPMSYDIRKLNKDCKKVICSYCGGKGMLSTSLHKDLTYIFIRVPCNICKGKGYLTVNISNEYINCVMFNTIHREFNVTLPKGIYEGLTMKYNAEGNDVFTSKDIVSMNSSIGDLILVIQSVKTKVNNDIEIFVNSTCHVNVNIPICATEALNGFERNITYIKNMKVHINRRNKITLPDTVIVLPKRGIPLMVASSNNTQTNEDNNNTQQHGGNNNNNNNNNNTAHQEKEIYSDMSIKFILQNVEKCVGNLENDTKKDELGTLFNSTTANTTNTIDDENIGTCQNNETDINNHNKTCKANNHTDIKGNKDEDILKTDSKKSFKNIFHNIGNIFLNNNTDWRSISEQMQIKIEELRARKLIEILMKSKTVNT